MKIPGIEKVSLKTKTFVIDDFGAITVDLRGGSAEKNQVVSIPSLISTNRYLPSGIKPIKLYCVEDEYYLYASDGKIYKDQNGKFIQYKIATLNQVPTLFNMIHEGKKSLVVTADVGGYVINDTFAYLGIPTAETYAYYCGKLFYSIGRKIYICGETDYTGYNINFNKSEYISTDASLGSVKKLIPSEQGLYVFCSRGIAIIKVCADSFGISLKRVVDFSVKAYDNSIKLINGEIYYLGVNGFCVLSGNSVKKIESIIDKGDIVITGDACVYKNYYVLPIKKDDSQYYFCYDTVTGKQGFAGTLYSIMADGGYAVSVLGAIYQMVEESNNKLWRSKMIDLNEERRKFITRIFITLGGDAELTVSGEFSDRVFNLVKGENVVDLSVCTKTIKLGITCEKNFQIEKIKIEYRI